MLWTSGYFNRKDHLEFIRAEQKKGKTFGHYTCATTVRASLAKNFRRNPWFGEYHALDYNNMYQAVSNLVNCAWKGYCGDALLYTAIQMNDNETRVMTFTSVCRVTMTPGVISTTYGTNLASMIRLDPINLMGPIFEVAPAASNPDTTPPTTVKSSYVTPVNGRIFFAGFLFDRFRIRSESCTIRPSVMPSSATAGNFSLYAAWNWDR